MSRGDEQGKCRIHTGETRHSQSNRRVWRFVALIGLLLIPWVVQAAEFLCAAGDVICLITAINTANADRETHTIHLAAGTYTLTTADHIDAFHGSTGLPVITGDIMITGAGTGRTIIERENHAPPFRIFHVERDLDDQGLTPGRLVLSALTVQGGLAQPDGDQFFAGRGGGILSISGELIVNDAAIIGNTAETGGGIFNEFTLTTIARSVIAGNTARRSGGGIGNFEALLTITHSTISGNDAAQAGGGLFFFDSDNIIDRSSIFGNTGGTMGGGIHNGGSSFFGSTLRVTNSTIAGNEAEEGGGLFNASTTDLLNSTITGNTAARGGGIQNAGAFDLDDVITLQNTIVAKNSAPVGPDCHIVWEGQAFITSLGHSIVGDIADCDVSLQASDLTGDPQLGSFLDPGIPGQGRVPLRPDSPAIDAGDDEACPDTDQLGHPRIDGTGDGQESCDIGAVEFYPVVNRLVTLNTLSGAFRGDPAPETPAGTVTITATLTNTSPTAIRFPFFEVIKLSGGHLLLNADGGAGGRGANLTPEIDDALLAPEESMTVVFVIGLQRRRPFVFLVNLLGEPQR